MGALPRLNTVELGSKAMPADQFSGRAAGCTVFKTIQDIDLNCQVAMHYLEQITRLMGHSLMPLVNQTHYDFILPGNVHSAAGDIKPHYLNVSLLIQRVSPFQHRCFADGSSRG